MGHISDTDFERYHRGMVNGDERDRLEDHMLGCPKCAELAEAFGDFVEAMRAGIIKANLASATSSSVPGPVS
jgi:hypothetical protein